MSDGNAVCLRWCGGLVLPWPMIFPWNEFLSDLETRELLNIDLLNIVREKLLDRMKSPLHA